MRVPASDWEAAQEARNDGETWGDYLRRCADEPQADLTDEEVEELVNKMDDVSDALR
jgi:Ca2+-binding EF-hand superfamily protein